MGFVCGGGEEVGRKMQCWHFERIACICVHSVYNAITVCGGANVLRCMCVMHVGNALPISACPAMMRQVVGNKLVLKVVKLPLCVGHAMYNSRASGRASICELATVLHVQAKHTA